ncbi:hypothetical protein FQA39_LY05859 [Lamprigera yunnana]|nr:hypothetical protein FQA39_LY05859 [Lamprigera yunnana]
MASKSLKFTKQVKPILSLDRGEAKRRVINLYKAWYKEVPYIVRQFDIAKSEEQCRVLLRQEFVKHENVTDIRIIDMLIVKGQMELQECVENWKQKGHVMDLFKEHIEKKPTDFLSKFIAGLN